MNLYEAIYELHGYVKAIGDHSAPIDEFQKFIDRGEKVSIYPEIPDKAQWYRICHDLRSIVNLLENMNKKCG